MGVRYLYSTVILALFNCHGRILLFPHSFNVALQLLESLESQLSLHPPTVVNSISNEKFDIDHGISGSFDCYEGE